MEIKENAATPSSSGLVWIVVLLIAIVVGVASLNAAKVVHPVQTSSVQPTQPTGGYSIYGKPSLSANQVNAILKYYGSPAIGTGQEFYADSLQYGIDDAVPLAFFFNESTMGTDGMARSTLAIGNERCIPDRACVNTLGAPCQSGQSCYAQMTSWSDGVDHWYQLLSGPVYRGDGLTTIEMIIPRYAPSGDNNVPSHYITTVETCVNVWRSGKVAI